MKLCSSIATDCGSNRSFLTAGWDVSGECSVIHGISRGSTKHKRAHTDPNLPRCLHTSNDATRSMREEGMRVSMGSSRDGGPGGAMTWEGGDDCMV